MRRLPVCAVLVPALLATAGADFGGAVSRDDIAQPIVLYTDIASGPNSGGENNNGVYLSVFGKNFGTAGLGTEVRLFLNNVEVAEYRFLGPSKGRTDIQQLTAQIGALGNPVPGKPLPVKVVVGKHESNTNVTFAVWPGEIFFVDNVIGVDTDDLRSGGTFAQPFKSVQKKYGARLSFAIEPAKLSGAWGRVRAGDFIVMRGSGRDWTDVGFNGFFLQTLNKSGCEVGKTCPQGGGETSGPITLMGYPGEDVRILNQYDPGRDFGAISSADSARIAMGMGAHFTITNLRIEGGNHDGAINTQAGGSFWRVVNNDLSAASAVANAGAKAGGIAGSGKQQFFVGNRIHDVFCGQPGRGPLQNHGIYIDGTGSYEVAYNSISRIPGGNGIQVYTNRDIAINDISIHHNQIDHAGKHGINIADGAGSGVEIYNNLISNSEMAGIRLNSRTISGAKIANNTIVISDRSQVGGQRAALMNDAVLSREAVEIRNNIIFPGGAKRNYLGGSVGFSTIAGAMSHNLWHHGKACMLSLPFGNQSCIPGSHNVFGDPRFVSNAPVSLNLRLTAGSPAIDAGARPPVKGLKDDFEFVVRPVGTAYDIGAFEYSVQRK